MYWLVNFLFRGVAAVHDVEIVDAVIGSRHFERDWERPMTAVESHVSTQTALPTQLTGVSGAWVQARARTESRLELQ